MNNSKWKIYKVGLINFWYYDEEEFHFLDGKMLLRGSNGSGKSVTMQSFIPLLLDGNMRPERLDPFGSRARKMENYILEEDDDREERTGYLYMELKREDADRYVTIGIGLRGRKNKKLETWYFCINDGRRIGHEMWLYKDVQNKVPYTKVELRNRIGEGGRVMESQSEYMECVNKNLFGFETIDEYKEMIELLIQLRTPKLSKDFKPSIINEILSSSLQTLSEDDLRPMSEAIENMDGIKTNLDNLQASIKAAKNINRVYEQYNKSILYDKAKGTVRANKDFKDIGKKNHEIEDDITNKKADLLKQRDILETLKREEEVLEAEEKSLSQNDAVILKKEEYNLSEKITKEKKDVESKIQQQEKKENLWKDENEKAKEQQEKNENFWEVIEEDIDEMKENAVNLSIDTCTFLEKDVKENKGEDIKFDIYESEFQNYHKKVEDGIKVLKLEEQEVKNYNEVLKDLDRCREERNTAEKDYNQYEILLHEISEELIESLYKWEKNNQVFHVTDMTMQKVSRDVEQYRFGVDFSEIKDSLRAEKDTIKDKITDIKNELKSRLEPKKAEIKELKNKLMDIKKSKDPEPERSKEVKENRQKLKALNIPFYEFYKVVDFTNKINVDEKRAGYLEEALLRMGILDALIVSEEYKSKVLSIDEGLCDKYIFDDIKSVKNSIVSCLDIDNPENDIMFYTEISKALACIGDNSDKKSLADTWIDENGNYKIGILQGNITKQYKPKFIGAAARERYKKEKIAELEEMISNIQDSIDELQQDIEQNVSNIKTLDDEWNSMPKENDLKVAAKQLHDSETKLEDIGKRIKQCEERLQEKKNKLDEIRLKVQEVCSKTYLTIRLDVFEEVLEDLKQCEKNYRNIRNMYSNYRNGLIIYDNHKNNMENIDIDLDDIKSDRNKIEYEIKILEEKIKSIKEQLKLTDYDKIKEKLDYCVKRRKELPREKENAIVQQTKLEDGIESMGKVLEKNKIELQKIENIFKQMLIIFDKEYELKYTDIDIKDDDISNDILKIAVKTVKILEGQVSGKSIDEIHNDVQRVFHENKGDLAKHNMSMSNIFDELKEECSDVKQKITRINIDAKYRGTKINFGELVEKLVEDMENLEKVLSDKDKELFEDILANTISKKIRAKIHKSKKWVANMNQLMGMMQTSSGLKLNLKWKSKKAEKEEQLDTRKLVELLEKDGEIMRMDEIEKMSIHFRSKITEARKRMSDVGNVMSFHMIMKEILDYRRWFEFQLEFQKTGERKKELTDREFFKFSGGEKAMAMYVPLFSAVAAKYDGARDDAPRLISLDEAFAGVDEMNIKDMFRLMVEFEFNFMINSQILWGDYETVPKLAIYQLIRPENAKFVSVISYIWNGKTREMVDKVGEETEQ